VLGSSGHYGFDPDGFTLTATVSPDGKQVAVAVVQAGGVEFFDSATGKSVRRLAGRGAPVKRLVYSPDGTHLAALGFDGAVQLWDLTADKRLGVVESPVGDVAGVVFPEAGKAIAWATDGRAVALWEVPSGKRLHDPEGHTKAVTSILFSADGKTVFTAGADHVIAEWDAATGTMRSASRLKLPERVRPERRQAGSPPPPSTPDVTVLSPDGKRVAVAANRCLPHELLILDRATGTELLGLKTGFMPPRWYLGPTFTADGTRLFYPPAGVTTRPAKEYTASVWEIDSGLPVCEMPLLDGSMYEQPFAFSPDGARVVRLSVDRDPAMKASLVLTSWNSATGAKVAELVVSTEPGVVFNACWLAVASDSRTAVVAVGDSDARPQRLFTWDYTTGKVVKEIGTADGFAFSGPIAVNPDGKTFVAVGRLGKKYGERTLIRVYDLATGEARGELLGSAEWVTVLAFSPDGKTLASGSHDTTVLLWDLSAIEGK
jgi:WD40 repeat protein